MFYAMERWQKIVVSVMLFIAGYFLFTVIFGLGDLILAPTPITLLGILPRLWGVKLLICGALVMALVWIRSNNLEISAHQVGKGQHGSARWATPVEKKKEYTDMAFGRESAPGLVLEAKKRWLIDASDSNALLVAPPGAGKTKRLFIPSIYYNAMVNENTDGQGASMIITDCKGELLQKCGSFLLEKGYRVLALNFAQPLKSACFNLLNNVNQEIDLYHSAQDQGEKLLHYGRAERYAKILASSVVVNLGDVQKSDSGSYFTETSKGLLTGMILLVSEYGQPEERHIISVFRLIIELNGLTEDSSQAVQKNRLQELLAHIDNDRIWNYVGPATSADVRTSMNVFSSALGKLVQFIDAELEPMVCNHSPELGDLDFIKNPSAIFLVCPDSNTTRHFFAALFIRYLMNDLIVQADESPSLKLSREVIAFWDEYGNMPPIKDIDVLVSAARSRGIRFLFSLQSYGQLEKNYSHQMAKIIKDCCQITISTYVSPNSRETAEELSKVLGQQTVQSGSITKGHGYTQNLQMIGRALLTPDEIINLQPGNFLVLKAGCRPVQTSLPFYWEYMPEVKDYTPVNPPAQRFEIHTLTADKVRTGAQREKYKITKGMFDT